MKNSVIAVIAAFFLLSPAAGQTGEQTYIIKKGDTLWDLAFKFLGDPFKWSQLWHQNQYITNPNLIYPGNTLIIGGTAAESEAQASGSGSQRDAFFSETKQALNQSDFRSSSPSAGGLRDSEADAYDSLFRIAMRKNKYFTSDFLEKMPFLWNKKDEKGLLYPGNATLRKMMNSKELLNRYERETYQQHEEVLVEPLSKAQYRPGDTVDIYHSDGLLRYQAATVNLVRRVGRAAIQSVDGNKISAVLFKMWDVVESGDRVDTTVHFSSLELDTLLEPDVTIKGTVFTLVEESAHPQLFQTFIFDKGSKDGVRLGDVFRVEARNSLVFDKPSAIACALHVDETSSTLVIEKLTGSIAPGDTVSLVKRIRFK